MQANNVSVATTATPVVKAKEADIAGSPVLARLIKEVKNNNNPTMAYDRVHNRHNRGR